MDVALDDASDEPRVVSEDSTLRDAPDLGAARSRPSAAWALVVRSSIHLDGVVAVRRSALPLLADALRVRAQRHLVPHPN
jgi:hypothetical protein